MLNALREQLSELPLQNYAAGQVILPAGTRTGCLMFLESGRVGVRRDGVTVSKVREPGAVFGEMSLLLGVPHTADVVALDDCSCRVVEHADSFLMERPAMMAYVAAVLAHRLDAATRYLVDVKAQLGETPGHLSMIDEVLASLVNRQPRNLPVVGA